MLHISKKTSSAKTAAKTRDISMLVHMIGMLGCLFIACFETSRIERSRVEYTSEDIASMAAPIAAALREQDRSAVFLCSADQEGNAAIALPESGFMLPSSHSLVDDSPFPHLSYFRDLCPGAYDFVVRADGTAVLTRNPFYGRISMDDLRHSWEASTRAERQQQMDGIAAYIKENSALLHAKTARRLGPPRPKITSPHEPD